MKKNIAAVVLMGVCAVPALADKSEWANVTETAKEKAMDVKESVLVKTEQMKAKKDEKVEDVKKSIHDKIGMLKDKKDSKVKESKEALNEKADQLKKQKDHKVEEVKATASEKLKGLEKQKSEKTEQVMGKLEKETEKSTDTAKEVKEENSQKWWKFWGE